MLIFSFYLILFLIHHLSPILLRHHHQIVLYRPAVTFGVIVNLPPGVAVGSLGASDNCAQSPYRLGTEGFASGSRSLPDFEFSCGFDSGADGYGSRRGGGRGGNRNSVAIGRNVASGIISTQAVSASGSRER